jgi:hypothetical protein
MENAMAMKLQTMTIALVFLFIAAMVAGVF